MLGVFLLEHHWRSGLIGTVMTLAQELGYPTMFTILGCFAPVSTALWVGLAGVVKPACAAVPGDGRSGAKLTSGALA